jgi:hypothetical protein
LDYKWHLEFSVYRFFTISVLIVTQFDSSLVISDPILVVVVDWTIVFNGTIGWSRSRGWGWHWSRSINCSRRRGSSSGWRRWGWSCSSSRWRGRRSCCCGNNNRLGSWTTEEDKGARWSRSC